MPNSLVTPDPVEHEREDSAENASLWALVPLNLDNARVSRDVLKPLQMYTLGPGPTPMIGI